MRQHFDLQANRNEKMRTLLERPAEDIRRRREAGQSCAYCIEFLRRLRDDKDTKSFLKSRGAEIQGSQNFVAFCEKPNTDVAHYRALFSILKEAGFSEPEIRGAVLEHPPYEGDAKKYIVLAEEALRFVFVPPVSPENMGTSH